MVIALEDDEEALLMDMKSKTRYNVRLAGRRGVVVRQGTLDDLHLLYEMYAETSVRDGFVIRHEGYYEDAWGTFVDAGLAQPFIAEVEGQPVAALIAYRFGHTAYYLYGMSASEHREKMPNYLLQWEAMRWAKAQGCKRYDLWGAPDRVNPDDPMYGVYRFKDGFGAEFVRTVGAWDLPLRPFLYALYTRVMPLALGVMRVIGRTRTRQSIDA
jgi:lipid II:glycine glycyltransferase (peptidoglycan interpeptide bridge formation enzyme)